MAEGFFTEFKPRWGDFLPIPQPPAPPKLGLTFLFKFAIIVLEVKNDCRFIDNCKLT